MNTIELIQLLTQALKSGEAEKTKLAIAKADEFFSESNISNFKKGDIITRIFSAGNDYSYIGRRLMFPRIINGQIRLWCPDLNDVISVDIQRWATGWAKYEDVK